MLRKLIVCFIFAALFSAALPAFAQEATLTPPPTNEPTFIMTVEPAAPPAEATDAVSDSGGDVTIINNPQPPASNTNETTGSGGILANILSGLVGGFIGLIAGLAGAIGMARSLKSDTNALTIMERVITAIAVATNKPELIPSVNKLGEGLQDVGDVLKSVSDNQPNDLPPVSTQSRVYRPPTPPNS